MSSTVYNTSPVHLQKTVLTVYPLNHHTISTYVVTYRDIPCHTIAHHVQYHIHVVPTPPEGLNHTSMWTQEEHAFRAKEQERAVDDLGQSLSSLTAERPGVGAIS